jgi:N-acetylneuraminic acid mutarotase
MSMQKLRTVLLGMTLLGVISTPGSGQAETRSLSGPTFDQRVASHRAVEEVYWRHRLWPEENRTSKPSLDAVLSPSLVRRRAEDALLLSAALEVYWGRPITGAQLQAEIDRQARDSRQPGVLRELWQALGSDPQLVAETLARPVLAERLARSSFAEDRRFAGRSFDAWWLGVRGGLAMPSEQPSFPYRLPRIAGSARPGGDWNPTFSLPEAEVEATAVWTGSEMIVWGGTTEGGGGKFNSGSRYDPATDTWRPTSAVEAAAPRKQHSAVWTGTEMIVWGGCGQLDEHDCQIDTGGRYDPITNTWQPTSQVDAPGPRMDHTAVWTGSEMIVWGGCAFVRDDCVPEAVGSDGGAYDPETDSWRATSLAGAPTGRHFHTAVWTGTEMIVWGGQDDNTVFNTGGRYAPAADSWTPTTTAGAPSPRWDHTAVWTGNRMIVWGGCPQVTFCSDAVGTGGQYSPATDRWRPVQQAGAPAPRGGHTAVWTGREMVVWGGCSGNFCGGTFLDSGGRYRPRSDSWTPTSQVNTPQPRTGHLAVWTGSLMVVWGGDRVALYGSPRTGGRYDPRSDTWTPTNASEAPSARYFHTIVWTGAEMIVWGGDDRIFGTISTGGRYTPATDSWQPTATAGAPGPRFGHSALWTGTEMIVWGGQYGSEIVRTGRRYNPITDTWTPTATAGAPAARSGHSAVWTGSEMIVWGGSGNPLWMNTGGRYDPATDTWTPTATVGAPRGRDAHTAVWTGSEMIVWGGYSNGSINSGGRYDPDTNSWTPTSRAGEPSPRSSHAAVWTGTEMIIWGGWQYDPGLPDLFNDGARYDPATDQWSPITLLSAPSRRAAFAYVWTGTELIVWGGSCFAEDPGCGLGDGQYTGGQYDPAADRWIPTTTSGAPGPFEAVRGIWTGTEMIVWGGIQTDNGTPSNHGGRYVPLQGEDVTPPVISEVAAIGIGEDSATIVWTTDEGATSQVEYGLTPDYGSMTELDPALVLEHGVTLDELASVTEYHFRVRSIDGSGNESVSGDYTFRTIDVVAVTSAEQCWMSEILWVQATGTDPSATLTVYDTNGGEFIGEMDNLGDGRYRGRFDWAPILSQIDVISSSGGMGTRVVAVGSC